MADDLNPPLSSLASRTLSRASTSLDVPKVFVQNAPGVWGNLRRRRGSLLASVALLTGGLVWLGWPNMEQAEALVVHRSAPPPLPVLAAPPPAPALPELIQLDDGSTIQLRTANDTLGTQEQSEERVRLRLSGGAHFDVAPEPPQSFVVESAQVLVRVLGTTAFSVDPEDARTRVAVERGRVQIMWWRGATILRAGESAVFPPENESAFGRSAPSARQDPAAPHPKHATKRKKSRGAHAVDARAHAREHAVDARAHAHKHAVDARAHAHKHDKARLAMRSPSASKARPHGEAASRRGRRGRRAGMAH